MDKTAKQATMNARARQWIARLLILAVFAMNVTCALQFIFDPGTYTASYELEGSGAAVAIQGIGIVFLMWNATYPPVAARPHTYRTLFAVVLAQQAIGLIGETALLLSLGTPGALHASILRFIVYDAIGLVALIVAFLLTRVCKDAS